MLIASYWQLYMLSSIRIIKILLKHKPCITRPQLSLACDTDNRIIDSDNTCSHLEDVSFLSVYTEFNQ